jgi:hypothetical protein
MWRLRTAAGVWAVKQLNRSREAWWTNDYRVAAAVEQAAWDHGIAMPRPVHPVNPVAPLLADVTVDGAAVSFRVHEWCAGRVADDIAPEFLHRVGQTLAALHTLPLQAGVAGAVRYEPHELSEWRQWLTDAPHDVPAGFLDAVRAHLPDIALAKHIVEAAWLEIGDELTAVLTHRDVKPDNILLTRTSPVLVDWDEAGLDLAEWEVTRAALAFSRHNGGWDHRRFDLVVGAYLAVGGRPIRPAPAFFAGVLRHQLLAAAFLLFRALGHRPVTVGERTAAYGHTLEFLAEMRASLGQLPQWTVWLRDITRP